MSSVDILSSLEMSGGCLGDVWGYLSGIHGNWRHSDMFEGFLEFQYLQYGGVALF